MKPLTKVLTVGAVLSTLALNAFAVEGNRSDMMPQRGASQSENRGGDPIAKLLKEIELSDAQTTALQTLAESFQIERESAPKGANSKDQDLADAISESGLNSAQLVQAELEHCEARSTMHSNHLSQIIDVLTSEQRLELKALLEAKASEPTATLENLGY
jgi:Spy/CpxP family protein refolding chaperone